MDDLRLHDPGFFNRFFRVGLSNSLQDDFLGYCTSVWEKYCYTKNKISDPKAIELAKLCSILVDAPKQGLSILPSVKEEIKKLGGLCWKPAYKGSGIRSQSTNVIDRLHFDVAEQMVEEKKIAFHNSFGETPSYDPLITAIYHRENGFAAKEGPGKPLALALKHLMKELQGLREEWGSWNASRNGADEFKSGVLRFYRQFREIKPPNELSKDPVISRWASEEDSHFSYWSLLRASTAFYKWGGQKGLVWYMTGRELCFIKSHGAGIKRSDFGPRSVIEEMYVPLKTSGRFRGIKATVVEKPEEEDA